MLASKCSIVKYRPLANRAGIIYLLSLSSFRRSGAFMLFIEMLTIEAIYSAFNTNLSEQHAMLEERRLIQVKQLNATFNRKLLIEAITDHFSSIFYGSYAYNSTRKVTRKTAAIFLVVTVGDRCSCHYRRFHEVTPYRSR